MLVIKELFSDSERFFTEYYKPIKTRDTLTYVYEGKKPAYHNKISCVRLNSDYENFEIPELIKDGGITEIEKFNVTKTNIVINKFQKEIDNVLKERALTKQDSIKYQIQPLKVTVKAKNMNKIPLDSVRIYKTPSVK